MHKAHADARPNQSGPETDVVHPPCEAGGSAECTALAGGTVTTTPNPVPLPLPLFATGLGVLGLLGWRRKRKAV